MIILYAATLSVATKVEVVSEIPFFLAFNSSGKKGDLYA